MLLHRKSIGWDISRRAFLLFSYKCKYKNFKRMPFVMEGGDRIDDTAVHKALRAALANCLIYADYYGIRDVIVKKESNRIIFENPGYIRTGKIQMHKWGELDPGNKSLLKMFNLINIGERFDPDRTILLLEFFEKQAIKTAENIKRIRKYLKKFGEAKIDDIAVFLNLSPVIVYFFCIFNDKRNETETQVLFEYDQPADSAVAMLMNWQVEF